MTIPFKIQYKDDGIEEGVGGVAVQGGHFVAWDTTTSKYIKNATAGASLALIVLQSSLYSDPKEEIPADSSIRMEQIQRGRFYRGLVGASATAIVLGDALELSATGTIGKRTTGAIIGYALEAVDNSSGSSEVYIKFRGA